MRRSLLLISSCFLFIGAACAEMPPGAGLDQTRKVCGKCHSPEQAASVHQGREAWEETISKMVNMGAEGSDTDFEAVLGYLTKNFGPEAVKPVNVNTATPVEIESVLGLTRAESAAVVQFRTAKGNFKALEDLKSVPGLDYSKIEKKKALVQF